jgi:hypothetical protein
MSRKMTLEEAICKVAADFKAMSPEDLNSKLAQHAALLEAEGRKPIFYEFYDFGICLDIPEGIAETAKVFGLERQMKVSADLNA